MGADRETDRPARRGAHGFHLAGWLLFVASAVFFIASSLATGDAIGLVGSVLFLVACLVFVWPLVRQRDGR